MNRLLIFVTMFCLSLSATQSYADSPIFVEKFKSIFSGSSEKSVKVKPSSKKPLSLKTKKTKRLSDGSRSKSSIYGSVSNRFKNAVRSRDMIKDKRKAKKVRMIQESIMLAEQERENRQQLANQRIAAAQKRAASGTRQDRKTKTTKNPPSSKRFVIKKSDKPKVDQAKGNFPAPIFKNFR